MMKEIIKGSLSAEHLNVWLDGKQILRDINFRCAPGLVGLLGNNGSGKTTLFKGLLHMGCRCSGKVWLERPGTGISHICGGLCTCGSAAPGTGALRTCDGQERIELSALSGRRKAAWLAYSPQESAAVSGCSVLDFVVMGRTPYLGFLSNPGAADYAYAEKALDELGIGELKNRFLDRLSGGERKMAYLARAKVQQACWMLLDEPAAGLDYGRAYRFFHELSEYVQATGTGALVSVHDPLLAYTFCRQMIFIRDGRISAYLTREDTDFEQRFLEQLRFLTGMKAELLDTESGRTICWETKA